MDLFLFNICNVNYGEERLGGCLGSSVRHGTDSEHVELYDVSGEIYVVVDSKTPHKASGYKIKVHCGYDDDPIDDPDDDPDDPDDDPDDDPVTGDLSLECGQSIHSTTIGGTSTFDNEDIMACLETNLLYTGPDQLISFEKVNDDDHIELTLQQSSANLSLFVLDANMDFVDGLCRGYNFTSDKIIDNPNNIGEVFFDGGELAAGTYYALIEGYNHNIMSDFTLSLACRSDDCMPSDSVTCESILLDIGLTDSLNNRSSYLTSDGQEFVGYTGGEWIGKLTIDEESEIQISAYDISEGLDLDIFVADSCSADTVIAYSVSTDSSYESLTVVLQPGMYSIIVDGWLGGSGSFDLEVTGCADPIEAIAQPIGEARNVSKDLTSEALSIMPNPFAESTRITVSSDIAQEAQLQFLSIDGRLIYSRNLHLEKGTNMLQIGEELSDNYGVIIYRLVTSIDVRQGNLIRVR